MSTYIFFLTLLLIQKKVKISIWLPSAILLSTYRFFLRLIHKLKNYLNKYQHRKLAYIFYSNIAINNYKWDQ